MTRRGAGLMTAATAFLIDQAFKFGMIHGYQFGERQPIEVTSFFTLVMAWNPGISYSLFPATSLTGRLVLLAVTLAATGLLAAWLWRAETRLSSVALGLLVGGALGNAVDRALYGAVADFFHFHVGSFSWYVFNLADVAIVAGVALLLYESFFADRARRAEAPGAPKSP